MIDPSKVTQLVFCAIDKSISMSTNFDGSLNRSQAAQRFFIKFTGTCYKYRINSLYGSIMFSDNVELRNQLNPLVNDFHQRMIIPGETPSGGARIFTAIKRGADLLLQAKNRYPNAVLRIIVISNCEDSCSNDEIACTSNYILHNNIKIDSIFLSNQIARGLVAISRFSGGVSFSIRNIEQGLELFSSEEFINVNIRQFGPVHAADLQINDIANLQTFTENDLDHQIPIKPNEFSDNNLLVITPSHAISQYENANPEEYQFNLRRILSELRKIINYQDESIKVFPLKDRIDVWRVLLKGPGDSRYDGKWFYMILIFPQEYPSNYPLMRFIKPPFHPNITDLGKIDLVKLDQEYRSDLSILNILQMIKDLLLRPEYDSCVDLKRDRMKNNETEFLDKINEWNDRNGKNSSEDWEREWRIEQD